jgi:cell division septal protein FtsQ
MVLVEYAQQHPYFTAEDIVLLTDGQLTQEEVWAWGELSPGVNILSFDVWETEQRLELHPWIRTAKVSREFPQRIHVMIREHHPVALIRHEETTYLDATREIFVDPSSDVRDLPYLTGLERIPLDTQTAQTVLAEAVECLSLSREWGVELSEINWDNQQGYTVFLADRHVVIRLGHEIRSNIFVLVRRVLETWPPDRPAAVFDTRFADQIVVHPFPTELHRRGAESTQTI